MTDRDDEIYFKIVPDRAMTKGFAYLIVSFEDYSKFQSMKWNMEKPDDEWKPNKIKILENLNDH